MMETGQFGKETRLKQLDTLGKVKIRKNYITHFPDKQK